jgi:hypothetical protein
MEKITLTISRSSVAYVDDQLDVKSGANQSNNHVAKTSSLFDPPRMFLHIGTMTLRRESKVRYSISHFYFSYVVYKFQRPKDPSMTVFDKWQWAQSNKNKFE